MATLAIRGIAPMRPLVIDEAGRAIRSGCFGLSMHQPLRDALPGEADYSFDWRVYKPDGGVRYTFDATLPGDRRAWASGEGPVTRELTKADFDGRCRPMVLVHDPALPDWQYVVHYADGHREVKVCGYG